MLKRAFIFWDHANIFHYLQELNIRINYDLVKARVARGYRLIATVMYLGQSSVISPKMEKNFDGLIKQGWFITDRLLKVHSSVKNVQTEVEDDTFLDLYDFAKDGAYEKAIIVSGDRAFVGVIKELKKLGMDIDIWSFRLSISRTLINEVGAENAYYFDDFMEEITLIDYSQDDE